MLQSLITRVCKECKVQLPKTERYFPRNDKWLRPECIPCYKQVQRDRRYAKVHHPDKSPPEGYECPLCASGVEQEYPLCFDHVGSLVGGGPPPRFRAWLCRVHNQQCASLEIGFIENTLLPFLKADAAQTSGAAADEARGGCCGQDADGVTSRADSTYIGATPPRIRTMPEEEASP